MQNKILSKIQYLAIYLTQAKGAKGIDNDFFKSVGNEFGGAEKGSPAGSQSAGPLILSAITILLTVAAAIATVFLMYGAFKYILARGNEEEAEGAKKTMTSAILGLVIIILSFVIIRIVSTVLLKGAGGLDI